MSKTLGQVAFEAWANLRHYNWVQETGKRYSFKDWEQQDELRREEWQAAAEAVKYTLENEAHDVALPHMLKREAVIEAAKALVQGYDFDQCEWKEGTLVALDEAVEALRELEE